MQRLRIDHVTEYRFAGPVTLLPHRLMLRPRENHDVRVASSTLDITPPPMIRWQRDALDNSVLLASFTQAAACLRIVSSVVIEHHGDSPLDFMVEPYAVTYPFDYLATDAFLLALFRAPTWPSDRVAVQDWLVGLGLRTGPIETFVLLDRLNRVIHDRMRYEAREEPGVQSPAHTLLRGAGSCRDLAALFMDVCRHLGLASRFISGYLHAPANAATAGATHAWAEVYLPGPGWKGFDPTCGEVTGMGHIAVAVAYHPEHVPPVAGSYLGTPNQRPTLHVSVQVHAVAD